MTAIGAHHCAKNPDANLPSDTGSFVIVKLIENVLSDLNHLRCNLDFQIL